MAGLIAPVFNQRVPFQFISDDMPSLSITGANLLQNNPSGLKIITGTTAKVQQDINLVPHIRGAIEAPPFSIQVQWKQLSYNDYLKIAALQPYYLTMITMRNLGYYGRLVLDGPESVNSSGDVVAANGIFYVISPSDDGGASSIARITAPGTDFNATQQNATSFPGYIQNTVGTLYYWLTFSSKYGETTAKGPQTVNPSANNVSVNITWNWPQTTSYCEYATLYCSTDLSGNNARKMADIPAEFVVQGSSPPQGQWIDYVGYQGLTVSQSLPSANQAYRGRWQYGIWWNES